MFPWFLFGIIFLLGLSDHRGLLESYSDSAHLATYDGQSSVVDNYFSIYSFFILYNYLLFYDRIK